MKMILALLSVVTAAAIWFWASGNLAVEPGQVPSLHPNASKTPDSNSAPIDASQSEHPERPPQEATRSIAEKNRILRQLNQSGELVSKSLDDIEKLVGPPTFVSDGYVIYRLDTGLGGFEWKLAHSNGIITAVVKTSLD